MTQRATWPIDKITVGTRYRKDLGDIRSLAESIDEIGLLHNVVITPDGKLIAGHRRLEAVRLLGRTEVPVSVVPLDELLKGEQQENMVRKDFLPSESVAIFEALKARESELAAERMRELAGTRPNGPCGNFPQGGAAACPPSATQPRTLASNATLTPSQPSTRPTSTQPLPVNPSSAVDTGKARDKASVGTGRSGRTIEKASVVVRAAQENPEKFGHLVDQMDKTGKVDGAFKAVKEAKRREEMRQAAPGVQAADASYCRIEQGDVLDVLGKMEAGSVAMVASDWPYNIGQHGGGTKVGPDYATFDPGAWDKRDQSEWLDWCQAVLDEFRRVLRPNGSLLMFTDRALISYLWDGLKAAGMRPKNTITWHKTNAAPNARGNLDSATEMAIWAVGGSGYTFHRPTTGQCPNIWSGPFVSGPTRTLYPHPTAKPVALIQHYLELFTNPGDLVLDPFGGSGATLEACLRAGRRCHTSDADPDYVATMATRYQDLARELGLQDPSPTAPDVQPGRPLRKRTWLVHARKLRNRDAAEPVEHTYREVARTAEEARERVRSLDLVVNVLHVEPAP